ncbi:MAG: hypothetical protein P8Y10_14425 [Gemmatimonadales bacterium]|jgi:hypothetical protein
MATIERPINLTLIFDGAARGVRMQFNVLFSEKEQELNLDYFIRAMLVEQDQAKDRFIIRTNGSRFAFDSVARQDKDDFIGFFPLATIKPDGENSKSVELEIDFDDPEIRERVNLSADPESGVGVKEEDLFAIVHVYSELSPSTTHSGLLQREIA